MTQSPIIDEFIDAIFSIDISEEMRLLKERDLPTYNAISKEMAKMCSAVS